VASANSLARIDAIFLTHQHSDHAAALDGLKKHPHIRVFANHGTSRALQQGLNTGRTWQLFRNRLALQIPRPRNRYLRCAARRPRPGRLPLQHRRRGDLFSPPRAVAWLTDLGHAPINVRERLRECDIVVVESNHCPVLLQADTRRPWSTKQRISGRHGHLSNAAAAELLASVASPRWRRVYLTHLSRDCNSVAAVEQAFAGVRATLTACEFSIVEQGVSTPVYELA
jgi:phosphoribosyl 1,2-cyclic phosphodiesterase